MEVPEDPAKPFLPSVSDGVMKIDPPLDPEKKAARKRAVEPCGKCQCCRRWKAKTHYTTKGTKTALANAQKWAAYWKGQYESLNAAKKRDHQSTER